MAAGEASLWHLEAVLCPSPRFRDWPHAVCRILQERDGTLNSRDSTERTRSTQPLAPRWVEPRGETALGSTAKVMGTPVEDSYTLSLLIK